LKVYGLGFRVKDLGSRNWALGFAVKNKRLRVEVSGSRVFGMGFRFQGKGFKVQSLVYRV
jgi:hypothetical protein